MLTKNEFEQKHWELGATLTLRFELLSNQWNKSTKKFSMSKFDIPPKVWAPLFVMLCTMWHEQPLENDDELLFLSRVIIEFLLPMLTAVLSTPTAIQFSQDTTAFEIILSILPNKASAVDNLHVSISNNWEITFPFHRQKHAPTVDPFSQVLCYSNSPCIKNKALFSFDKWVFS